MRALPAVFLMLVLGACSGGGESPERPAADTLSRRQRDSIIGASRLPGAGAVQRALEVSDSAAARAARLDSLPQ